MEHSATLFSFANIQQARIFLYSSVSPLEIIAFLPFLFPWSIGRLMNMLVLLFLAFVFGRFVTLTARCDLETGEVLIFDSALVDNLILRSSASLYCLLCRGRGGDHLALSPPRARWSRRRHWSSRGLPCLTVPAAAAAAAAALRLTRMMTLCPWWGLACNDLALTSYCYCFFHHTEVNKKQDL